MFIGKGIFKTTLWVIWSCSGIYSECHYDFRISKTKCTHHDGSVWISGVPEKQVLKSDLAQANSKLELRTSTGRTSSSNRIENTETSQIDSTTTTAEKTSQRTSFWDPIKRRYFGKAKIEEDMNTDNIPISLKTTLNTASDIKFSSKSSSTITKNKGSPWVASCFDRQCAFPWLDSKKRRIEAHGGGMIQARNGTFYWYGESQKLIDKSRGYGYSLGVNCYSSVNLGGPWVYEGMVLSQQSIWVKELNDGDRPFIIERPKVLYNEKTKKYVMWFHLDAADSKSGFRNRRLSNDHNDDGKGKNISYTDDHRSRQHRMLSHHRHRYWFRHAGVAMSDSPTGPFRFIHALQPDNLPSLDLQLFEDSNAAAYLIRSVNNEYVGMSRLTDDYLSTNSKGIVSSIRPCLEGMAVFRNPGDHGLYAIMSHLTGWEPNPLVLLRAHRTGVNGHLGEQCADGCTLEDRIQWTDLGNPSHHAKSFNQQPTYVMTLRDRHQTPYVMLMSDNWLYAGYRGLPDAGYIWLPLEFRHNSTVGIRKMKNWTLDAPFERRRQDL